MHTNDTEVSQKRYRYCGKERDEESGLYYYGARYYAAWLCRFTAVDPRAASFPYQSSFVYAANNPTTYSDYNGEYAVKEPEVEGDTKTFEQGFAEGFTEAGMETLELAWELLTMPGLIEATVDLFQTGENYYTQKFEQGLEIAMFMHEVKQDPVKQVILAQAVLEATTELAKDALFIDGGYEAGKFYGAVGFEVLLGALTAGAGNSSKLLKAIDKGVDATKGFLKSAARIEISIDKDALNNLYAGGVNPKAIKISKSPETEKLRHYTSNKGLEGIKSDMEIVARDQNKVFADKAKGKPLSAADASDKFGISKSSARNYVEFFVEKDRVNVEKNPITGALERTIKGNIKLDPKTTNFVKRR